MKPVISIIVPVYNLEAYLEKCIKSIIIQTIKNIEVILINDGSTDESGVICDSYASMDCRIKVIHKKNGGLSSARNAGMKIASGEYIGFVDGDDYVDRNMFGELYWLCENTNSDISICKFGRELNENLSNEMTEKPFCEEMDKIEAMRQLFKGELYRFSVCNKLFKKSCFENIVFPEGRIHEDLSTTYKLFSNANKVVYTNYIGYIYVKRDNSILASRFNEKRLDAFTGWEEILAFMKQKYPQLSSEVNACFVYSCVDNGYYILNQVVGKKEREKYLLYIQSYVRKYYKDIIKNAALTVKYKKLISIINISVRLFILSHALNNFRNDKLRKG
ncbi:glycosyltransferase family 2 protein [Neobacillus vireti]|uniref:Capsular polysaccharide biosynthsis protein n=1 Tax=Neobacillus vireti LMG 21834 TaxID=1131730 RepID=A0AB94IKG4_9BACI|nr:glycosyltransferase [Neobacillus vireti]ETI67556.1 capsular polysaccharide biosynthsis protein [Neobacillus vireti LMG 21834]KLT18493.1 capsular biosynthesis protein [Neobacillus vireti]